MEKIKSFIHRNPARVAAFVSSAVALVVSYISPDIPVEQAVIFILSSLGLGEYAESRTIRRKQPYGLTLKISMTTTKYW